MIVIRNERYKSQTKKKLEFRHLYLNTVWNTIFYLTSLVDTIGKQSTSLYNSTKNKTNSHKN